MDARPQFVKAGRALRRQHQEVLINTDQHYDDLQISLFIAEVPVIMRYDLKGGPSKMRVLRTIGTHLGVLLKHLPKQRIV